MDARWVWIKEDGAMDVARATLSGDDDWPEEVQGKPVGALIQLRKSKGGELTEYLCTNPDVDGQTLSYSIDRSGALAISWNDEKRLIYAAGEWMKLTLPNGSAQAKD
jgi:hypothetical protein